MTATYKIAIVYEIPVYGPGVTHDIVHDTVLCEYNRNREIIALMLDVLLGANRFAAGKICIRPVED